jgi:SAM-dependent methyltransferase
MPPSSGRGWTPTNVHPSESEATIAAFSRLLVSPDLEVSAEIAPGDEMYTGNLEFYLYQGRSALRCIAASALLAGISGPARILDLPCGHGRVLRYLRAAFPDAVITACDLDATGVEYCSKAFGAVGVVANRDPNAIQLEGHYDLAWCGSLLTHLDAHLWSDFLASFARVLVPGGLLVFTTHGRRSERWLRNGTTNYGLDEGRVDDLLAAIERTGFGYVDYPGRQDYGISLSRPSYVAGQVQAHPTLRLAAILEYGWDDHQDVIACVKSGEGDV